MAHCNIQHVVPNDARWLAKVIYKSDSGPIGFNYPFDDVEELERVLDFPILKGIPKSARA